MWSRLWKNTRWTRPSSSVEPSWTVTTWRNTYNREEEVYTQANTHPHQYKHNSLETLMDQLHISFFFFFLFWWWWEEGGGLFYLAKSFELVQNLEWITPDVCAHVKYSSNLCRCIYFAKKKLQRSLKSKAEWQWQSARLHLNNLPLIFDFSNFFTFTIHNTKKWADLLQLDRLLGESLWKALMICDTFMVNHSVY